VIPYSATAPRIANRAAHAHFSELSQSDHRPARTECWTRGRSARGQLQGFFDLPTTICSPPVIVADIKSHSKLKNVMVDLAAHRRVVRAPVRWRSASTRRWAIVDKRRERAGESEVMNIIGDGEGP